LNPQLDQAFPLTFCWLVHLNSKENYSSSIYWKTTADQLTFAAQLLFRKKYSPETKEKYKLISSLHLPENFLCSRTSKVLKRSSIHRRTPFETSHQKTVHDEQKYVSKQPSGRTEI